MAKKITPFNFVEFIYTHTINTPDYNWIINSLIQQFDFPVYIQTALRGNRDGPPVKVYSVTYADIEYGY